MAFASTTLVAAIDSKTTGITVASATNITAPNFTSGVGITYLWVEQEMMLVLGVAGTLVTVQRGYNGTASSAHGASAPVLSGLPADFGAVAVPIKAQTDALPPAGLREALNQAGAEVIVAPA